MKKENKGFEYAIVYAKVLMIILALVLIAVFTCNAQESSQLGSTKKDVFSKLGYDLFVFSDKSDASFEIWEYRNEITPHIKIHMIFERKSDRLIIIQLLLSTKAVFETMLPLFNETLHYLGDLQWVDYSNWDENNKRFVPVYYSILTDARSPKISSVTISLFKLK